MPLSRKVVGLLGAVALASVTVTAAPGAGAEAAPNWAPVATATIRPGAQVRSPVGQCTTNFVFTDPADAGKVYLGQAAHCTGLGGPAGTNGCNTASLPLGTPVTIAGAARPGILAYSSWIAMQQRRETDPAACAYNDLALVRLDPADVGRVNPSFPHWGGPVAGRSNGGGFGQRVYSYGNSSLRLGLSLLSPKTGVSLGRDGGGWNHRVLVVTPGIPGDSGSGFLDAAGRPLGVLSTLHILPIPAVNGVTDLWRALDYLRASGGPRVEPVVGTQPFTPDKLPLAI